MTPANHDRYMAVRHFGSLDGIRFLCITAVLWHHLPGWTHLAETLPLVARGHVGVDFFFVLSGFLITTLLLREESRTGAVSLRSFYWRRALRILPIYFLVVGVATTYAVVVKNDAFALEKLPVYAFFLQNFLTIEGTVFLHPTWSLAVEEQYYLIWPALLVFLPRRWIVPVLIGLIAINVLSAMGVWNLLGFRSVTVGILRFGIGGATYAPILMGSLVAILLNSPGAFPWLARLTGAKPMPWVYLAALILALATLPGALEGWPNFVVHSLMCLVLISVVVREDNGMAFVLRLPPIERIGQISYGIYLYHIFALTAVGVLMREMGMVSSWMDPVARTTLFFGYYALVVLIAEISFRTFEAYFQSFRGKMPGTVGPPQARNN